MTSTTTRIPAPTEPTTCAIRRRDRRSCCCAASFTVAPDPVRAGQVLRPAHRLGRATSPRRSTDLVPGTAHQAMLAVGVVEIARRRWSSRYGRASAATSSPHGSPASSSTCCSSAATTTSRCATSGCSLGALALARLARAVRTTAARPCATAAMTSAEPGTSVPAAARRPAVGRRPTSPAPSGPRPRFLTRLGVDDRRRRDGRDTPRRMARAYAEMLTPAPVRPHHVPQRRGLRRAGAGPRPSRCTRSASTTCCRSSASPTSATCRASGSSGCPSWRGSSSCSPAARRCRSGSRPRSRTGCRHTCSRAASGSSSRPSTCA